MCAGDRNGRLAAREQVVEPGQAPEVGTEHIRKHGLYPKSKT